MNKRPKAGESEEDLLRMQEEYLAEKSRNESIKPAAAVTNLRFGQKRSHSDDNATKNLSKFAQSRGLTNRHSSASSSKAVLGDILEKNFEVTIPTPLDDSVHFPQVLPSVLGEIVEKNYEDVSSFNTPFPSTGFPEVTKSLFRSKRQSIVTNLQNESLPMEVDEVCATTYSTKPLKFTKNIPEKSYIVSSEDSTKIHSENAQVLEQMSEMEILCEKEKLLTTLDPKIIEFMKSKRKVESSDGTNMDITVNSDNNTRNKTDKKIKTVSFQDHDIAPKLTIPDDFWENDILCHPDASQWLHFDSLEHDKLEWIKGVKESNRQNPEEPYEARFNFQGYLLPYTLEYTEDTKTLFHHGEEPHRPGYSLSELFQLSRSTVSQQRVMALNTIAGILEYASTGIYKDILEIPYSKILFILRIALDENKVLILEPALKAMRNLLCNRIEEASLDGFLSFEDGFQQPCLENDKSEINELETSESELKDFHLAEIDLISAALRTDIVQRIYYILDSVRPSFNCVQFALQILTRLARNSVETAASIVERKYLMNCIIRNFVPATGLNFMFDPQLVYKGKPVLAALKLLRVLSMQSHELNHKLVNDFNILNPISVYISSGIDSTYGLRIQIEAFIILSNMVSSRIGLENAMCLSPVIITSLFKHVQGTDVFFQSSIVSIIHAAAILQCVNKLISSRDFDNIKVQLFPLLKEGFLKWIAQVTILENYTSAHFQVVCSILDSLRHVLDSGEINFIDFIIETLKKLPGSTGYGCIVRNLVPYSNLLSNIENKDLYFIKNLVTLGCTAVDTSEKVLPVLGMKCPITFLLSLFKLLDSLGPTILSKESEFVLKLVQPLSDYLERFSKKQPALTDNWFTRIEINLIFTVLKVIAKTNVAENHKASIYSVANKLCYILRIDQRDELNCLFDQIVFNNHWFTEDILLNSLAISNVSNSSKVLSCIDEVKLCYMGIINKDSKNDNLNWVVTNWKEPILPRDWIYLPIVNLYSQHQDNIVNKKMSLEYENTKKSVILSSLEWILFNELCFGDSIQDIDLTDRFCRIMCVFLCDNSLFLDSNVKSILESLIRCLFQRQKLTPFNFDKQLIGLNNFQDFYTQFLEQFQSVSYGDVNFAACLLVPLAQRHNVKWRKLVWSEYAGCLRALDCPLNLLCYDLNDYLYPEETDESLLKCYFRALSSNLLRENTVVYKIASHHTERYKVNKVEATVR